MVCENHVNCGCKKGRRRTTLVLTDHILHEYHRADQGGQMPENDDGIDRVRVRILPDGRITRADAAAYLGYKPKTLAQWVSQGYGPRLVRVGGRVFYYRADLDQFIRSSAAAARVHSRTLGEDPVRIIETGIGGGLDNGGTRIVKI